MKKILGIALLSCTIACNYYAAPQRKLTVRPRTLAITLPLTIAATYAARFAYEWYAGNYESSYDILAELGQQDYELVMNLVDEIFNMYNKYSESTTWTPESIAEYWTTMHGYVNKAGSYAGMAKDAAASRLSNFKNFLGSYLRRTQKEKPTLDAE